jgi:hypothetical protein
MTYKFLNRAYGSCDKPLKAKKQREERGTRKRRNRNAKEEERKSKGT